jgi:HKD family nuclease
LLVDLSLLTRSSSNTLDMIRNNKNPNLHFLPMLGTTSDGGSTFHQKGLINDQGDYVLSSVNFSNLASSTIFDLGFSGRDPDIQENLKQYFLNQAYGICAEPEKILCALNSRFKRNKDRYHQILDLYSKSCDHFNQLFFKDKKPEVLNPYFFDATAENILNVLRPYLKKNDLKNVLVLTHRYSKNKAVEQVRKITPKTPLKILVGSNSSFTMKNDIITTKDFPLEPHLKGFLLNFSNGSLFLNCTSNFTANALTNSKELCFLVSDYARLTGIARYLKTISPYLTSELGNDWLPVLPEKTKKIDSIIPFDIK